MNNSAAHRWDDASDRDECPDDGEVVLYVYDMTKGLANSLSQMFLGRHIEGIWHTGIVVYGREYFYGGAGIESCHPGGTVLGQPDKIIKLGATEVPYSLFLEYVFALGESTYRPGTYDLFRHNCNNFSDEVATFLTGKSIPEYITNLPQDVLSTPLGESLRPLLESLSLRAEGSRGVSFGARAEQAAEKRFQQGEYEYQRELSPADEIEQQPQRLKDASKRSHATSVIRSMEDTPPERDDGDQRRRGSSEDAEDVAPARKDTKPREPPILYNDVNAAEAFEVINTHIKSALGEEELQCLIELQEFVISDTGAWALGSQHLHMIGRILKEKSVSSEGKVGLLRFLQAAALKDDVILLLHMDRQDHVLMNYINEFEQFEPEIQEEVAILLCNLCQPSTAADWLLYISEWENDGRPCSNSRVTTRVAVNSLLATNRPSLNEKGSALIYNLGLKEVFDDTATELASCILQYLHGDVPEEYAYRTMTALLKFMTISYNDVPQLVKMLGPDIGTLKGKSERVDSLVEKILFKLNNAIGL